MTKPISAASARTLEQLEALLVSERSSVKDALQTAFRLGYCEGAAEMAQVSIDGLKGLEQIIKAPA